MVVLAAMSGGGMDREHPAAPAVSIASAMAASTFLTTQFYRVSDEGTPALEPDNPKIHIKGCPLSISPGSAFLVC
jgi:hypothetical protein